MRSPTANAPVSDGRGARRRTIRLTSWQAQRSRRFEPSDDFVADHQGRGQPRAFDAEQLDETGHAMRGRPVNAEIGCRPVRTAKLGAHAAIGRDEVVVRQSRPVPSYRLDELDRTSRIDRVVDRVDPFDVWTEARLSGKI